MRKDLTSTWDSRWFTKMNGRRAIWCGWAWHRDRNRGKASDRGRLGEVAPPYFFFLCKYIKAQKPTSTDKSIMPTGGRLKDEQSPPLVAKFSMRKMLTKCSVQSLVVLSVSIYSPKARSKPLIWTRVMSRLTWPWLVFYHIWSWRVLWKGLLSGLDRRMLKRNRK